MPALLLLISLLHQVAADYPLHQAALHNEEDGIKTLLGTLANDKVILALEEMSIYILTLTSTLILDLIQGDGQRRNGPDALSVCRRCHEGTECPDQARRSTRDTVEAGEYDSTALGSGTRTVGGT